MRLLPSLAWLFLLIVPAALSDPELRESSGLAVSGRGILWSHNDGPNIGEKSFDSHVYSLGEDGGFISRVKVSARNSDWEDLAAFTYAMKNYLLIADTGDNLERRDESQLYVVEEPTGNESKLAWKIRFKYPDKAHDCEAVAVEIKKKRILLVTKRDAVSQIYSLPLHPDKSIQTATRLGTMWPLPHSSTWQRFTHPMLGPYTHQPTGLDISRDDRMAAVVTYDDAYLWRRKSDESWEEALAREPNRVLVLPGVHQYEGVAFSADGSTLYVSEEGESAITTVAIVQ
jgi:hypothetical protein